MLDKNQDAVSSATSMVEHGSVEEEDDSWVLVKKQKVTILVPPPSPAHPQIENQKASSSLIPPQDMVTRSSYVERRRYHKNSKGPRKKTAKNNPRNRSKNDDEHKKHAIIPSESRAPIDHREAQKSLFVAVSPLDHQEAASVVPFSKSQYCSDHFGDGNTALQAKRTFFPERFGGSPRMLVGAPSVVNLRLRAMNLERELKRVGGLKRWLVSQGLGRFLGPFEKEKLGKYQLVSLTMDKLKDMGTSAVGPRRKLICAIDNLCQPYFCKSEQ